jgi:drug/metabolite transporter (DMT)-like permease
MPAFWMLAASLLFACMGVCVKFGAERFTAGELVFYRGFIATLIVGSYMLWRRLPMRTTHLGMHLRRSLAGFVSLVAYFYAITLIPLATAVTLSYTSPLFLALLLTFWVKEGQGRRIHGALLGGFIGMVLLLQPTLGEDQWLGAVLGLVAGMVSSVAYLNVRRLGEAGEPEWRTVFYFSLFSSIGGLPWALASGALHDSDAVGWLLLLGVGGFGAAAQWCMTTAYARGRTLATASLAYSTVVFSSLFGVVLWEEILPPPAWVGIALIVVSGVAANRLSALRRAVAAEL